MSVTHHHLDSAPDSEKPSQSATDHQDPSGTRAGGLLPSLSSSKAGASVAGSGSFKRRGFITLADLSLASCYRTYRDILLRFEKVANRSGMVTFSVRASK